LLEETLDHLQELSENNRLAYVFIRARLQAAVTILGHGDGGQGNDGNRLKAGIGV